MESCCSVLGIHLINDILVHVNNMEPSELEAWSKLPTIHGELLGEHHEFLHLGHVGYSPGVGLLHPGLDSGLHHRPGGAGQQLLDGRSDGGSSTCMVSLWPPPRLAIQAAARGSRMLVGIRVTGSTVTWSLRIMY